MKPETDPQPSYQNKTRRTDFVAQMRTSIFSWQSFLKAIKVIFCKKVIYKNRDAFKRPETFSTKKTVKLASNVQTPAHTYYGLSVIPCAIHYYIINYIKYFIMLLYL